MFLRRKSQICWLFAALAAFVAASLARAAEPPHRLPNQIYNRMVYIRSIAADTEVFVNIPDHYDVGSPSISPDSKWIAFDAETVGTAPKRETWLVGVGGDGLRKLTDAATPRWLPDGKRLLISREIPTGALSSRFEVLEYTIAVGKEKKICDGRFADCSPDGKRIAFAKDGARTSNDGEHPGSKLWTAKADGTGAVLLCDGNWPSWSPDGKMIAYCVQVEKKPNEMWVIDLGTKKTTEIGLGRYRAQWAPDSKLFVCNGAFLNPGETVYGRAPAGLRLDRPMKPMFFGLDLDNPWSPCISRDGKTLVMVVDSQKRRGDENK